MRRRTVLALLAALALSSGSLVRRALAALGNPAREPAMAAIADTMLPGGDGLPPASALGLHTRVLAMPDSEEAIGRAIAWLDRYAASRGSADYVALDEAGRLAALDAAFASADDGIRSFVLAVRQSLIQFYYADPMIKKAFAYTSPPQPNGFADFQERPR